MPQTETVAVRLNKRGAQLDRIVEDRYGSLGFFAGPAMLIKLANEAVDAIAGKTKL